MRIVSSGKPAEPWRRAICPLSIAPTVRCTLRIGRLSDTGVQILDGLARLLDQLAVERVVQAVVLRLRAAAPHVARHRRIVEHRGEIDALRFPVVHVLALHEAIHAANHLVDFSEAELAP